jgi:predicted dehydrogenase
MAGEDIRVGLIGAGGNARNRHIPGFHKVKRVEIVGVVNRSLESSRRMAEEFNIPWVYNTWRELLTTEEISMVPFETGVHYMEWTEAVIRSAQTGQAIYLPL